MELFWNIIGVIVICLIGAWLIRAVSTRQIKTDIRRIQIPDDTFDD
jgi:hypothetical protein